MIHHDDEYLALLRLILEQGHDKGDRTGTGTRSYFGGQLRFDMRKGFPLLTTKKVAMRWVAEELFWFLRGSTNEQELRDAGVDIWKEWATEEKCAEFDRPPGDLGPIYGHQWRRFGATYTGIDPDKTVDFSSGGDSIDQSITAAIGKVIIVKAELPPRAMVVV